MDKLTTAVVICAYTLDRWEDLRSSVESAASQVPAPHELLVVVDHNRQLLERVQTQLVPHQPLLRVRANDRKQGLSGARNTALEHVAADVVIFLDDDASAEPGWLQALVAHYANTSVIAVGGSAQPHWPIGRGRPETLPSARAEARGELDWVVGCTYAGQPAETSPVRNLMGCNMSFRRSVFGLIPGFSEDLGRVGTIPLGCEETELCIRARTASADGVILFEPLARVHHRVSVDRLTWRYLLRRCYAEGISKAAVATMVGASQALSTERSYALRVLPQGLLRELSRAVTGESERLPAARGAAAIVIALAATVTGYVRARAAHATVRTSSAPRLHLL